MDKAKSATFLFDAEPVGAVQSIGMLIYSCSGFVFEYFDNIMKDASGDGQVFVHLRDVFNNGDLDRSEILIAKLPFLLFHLCQP